MRFIWISLWTASGAFVALVISIALGLWATSLVHAIWVSDPSTDQGELGSTLRALITLMQLGFTIWGGVWANKVARRQRGRQFWLIPTGILLVAVSITAVLFWMGRAGQHRQNEDFSVIVLAVIAEVNKAGLPVSRAMVAFDRCATVDDCESSLSSFRTSMASYAVVLNNSLAVLDHPEMMTTDSELRQLRIGYRDVLEKRLVAARGFTLAFLRNDEEGLDKAVDDWLDASETYVEFTATVRQFVSKP